MKIPTRRNALADRYEGFWIEIRWDDDVRRRFEAARAKNRASRGAFTLRESFDLFESVTVASNFTDHNDRPLDLTTHEGWQQMPVTIIRDLAHARVSDLERWSGH